MEDGNVSRQVIYDWIEQQHKTLDDIEAHVDQLPENSDDEWTHAQFNEVAHIAAHMGMLAGRASYLHEGLLGVLAMKIRLDARAN